MFFRLLTIVGRLSAVLFVLSAVMVSAPVVYAWEGVVVKVLDGDSIRVKGQGRVHEIRLYGIDAPEYGQAFGNKARKKTKQLVFGRQVDVDVRDTDKYGRSVAVVSFGGDILNLELVRSGLAWVYQRYCRDTIFCAQMEKAQTAARNARRGLWRDSNSVPPWQWKREKAGERLLR